MTDEPTRLLPVEQVDRQFLVEIGMWASHQRRLILSGKHDALFGQLQKVAAFRLNTSTAARSEALEEAAKAMENLAFFTPVDELLNMTKQEMSVRTCRAGADAIRAIASNPAGGEAGHG